MRRFLVRVAKKVLPRGAIDGYRRRRALRRYLRSLSHEIYDRHLTIRVEDVEGTVLASRPEITERLTRDLVARMDVVMQELHRQIEGLRARHGTELRELREELEKLRAALEELHARVSVGEPAAD